jgi:beta-lactamase class A
MPKIILNRSFCAAIILLLLSISAFAQKKSLKAEIEEIARASKGTVGVSVMDLSSRKTFVFNKNFKFPMQSVFKFPLAMAVLAEVDKGKFSLDQKILVTKKDLLPNTWSPIREKYPEGNVELTLAEILAYTVSQSDNNGCDILFRLLGGTANVHKYVQSLGVKEIAIRATEEEMARAWEVQFTNWSKPEAMLKLLEIFNRGDKLSKSSSDFLWKIMTETTTGPNRLKGLLPPGTSVAHKTGTSGTNDQKVTAAINDAGIMTMPNGKKIAIVVFVANSTDSVQDSEKIIARISKAARDFYAEQ